MALDKSTIFDQKNLVSKSEKNTSTKIFKWLFNRTSSCAAHYVIETENGRIDKATLCDKAISDVRRTLAHDETAGVTKLSVYRYNRFTFDAEKPIFEGKNLNLTESVQVIQEGKMRLK